MEYQSYNHHHNFDKIFYIDTSMYSKDHQKVYEVFNKNKKCSLKNKPEYPNGEGLLIGTHSLGLFNSGYGGTRDFTSFKYIGKKVIKPKYVTYFSIQNRDNCLISLKIYNKYSSSMELILVGSNESFNRTIACDKITEDSILYCDAIFKIENETFSSKIEIEIKNLIIDHKERYKNFVVDKQHIHDFILEIQNDRSIKGSVNFFINSENGKQMWKKLFPKQS